MSVDAIAYVKTLDVDNPMSRLLLFIIGENTFNDTGLCKVGQEVLWEETRASERTVRNHIKALEMRGVLAVHRQSKSGGGRAPDAIELVGFANWLAANRKSKPAKSAAKESEANRQNLPIGKGDQTGKQDAGSNRQLVAGSYKDQSRTSIRTSADACAHAREETDEQLPFSAEVIRELDSLGLDVEALIKRYRTRTKRKRIADPSAYLRKMGQDELAKKTGVSPEAIQACSAKNRSQRAANYAVASGAFDKPSEERIAHARRTRGDAVVDEALKSISSSKFKTQAHADKAFAHALSNAIFLHRQREAAE